MPGAWEDFPWGDTASKVGKKVFAFHPTGRDGVGVTVKLPQSADIALSLPFATPTGYGLGKSGWVSMKVDPDNAPPPEMFEAWIEESYRAVAPKSLVKELDARRA